MTTWTSSVRHPWYDKPSAKRKHSTDGDENTNNVQQHSIPLPYKRRRCSILEQGFAHLTLENPQLVIESAPSTIRAMSTDPDLFPSPVIHPSSIEEPSPTPEIRMKNSSWYEPEQDRIVITNLDDSDDELDPNLDLTVSSAFLDHIKTRPTVLEVLARQAASLDTCNALVLFKPVTVGVENDANAEEASTHAEFSPPIQPPKDDYAMDVGP